MLGWANCWSDNSVPEPSASLFLIEPSPKPKSEAELRFRFPLTFRFHKFGYHDTIEYLGVEMGK